MASVCIICHQEKSGEAVADTTVIRAIRAIKRKLNLATNNTLVVCPACRPAHAARRKSYEHKWMMHLLLGLGLVVLAIALPLLTGAGFNLLSILFVLLLAGLVAALALLDYMPPLARSPADLAPIESVPSPPALGAPKMEWKMPSMGAKGPVMVTKAVKASGARAPRHPAPSPRSKSKSKPAHSRSRRPRR